MKAKIVCVLLTLSCALCACGDKKEEPAKVDNVVTETLAEAPTEVKEVESKDRVLLSLFSGDEVRVSAVWADGTESEDTLNATMINGQKDDAGSVVSMVSSSSAFGDFFSTQYYVDGEHLERAVFSFYPQPMEEEGTDCAINYYDCLMEAFVPEADSVKITYRDSVVITGGRGPFLITFYPYTDEIIDDCGCRSVTFKSSSDTPTDVTVRFGQAQAKIQCSVPLSFRMDRTDLERNSEYDIEVGNGTDFIVDLK